MSASVESGGSPGRGGRLRRLLAGITVGLHVLGFLGLAAEGCKRSSSGGFRNEKFAVNGVALNFMLNGDGPPVVFLHELASDANATWHTVDIDSALDTMHHTVLSFDLPGHGQSDKPRDRAAYGVQMVEDTVLLMDYLHIARAQLIGYSLGSMIALKLAVMHPERVTALTLAGMGWARDGASLNEIWDLLPASDMGRVPPACIQSIRQLLVSEDELRAVKIPVEVVVGERDPVRQLYVAPLSAVRPDWTVVAIPDADHRSCLTNQRFREAIFSWVRANDPRPAL